MRSGKVSEQSQAKGGGSNRMPEMTRRQQEIVEIAIRLIAEGGIQRLTMSNIAKQIGISEPAIYRHFQSKKDILLALLAQFKRRSEFHLKQAQFFESSGIILLETIFLEHAGLFVKDPPMAAVLFAEETFRGEPQLIKEILSVMTMTYDAIANVIERAQSRGEFRNDMPKEHLALIIQGTLRFLVKRWYLSGYSFDLRQESERVWASLKMLLAPTIT